jgi:hypothetical protein
VQQLLLLLQHTRFVEKTHKITTALLSAAQNLSRNMHLNSCMHTHTHTHTHTNQKYAIIIKVMDACSENNGALNMNWDGKGKFSLKTGKSYRPLRWHSHNINLIYRAHHFSLCTSSLMETGTWQCKHSQILPNFLWMWKQSFCISISQIHHFTASTGWEHVLSWFPFPWFWLTTVL